MPAFMRRHLATILKCWLLRQATYAPLCVFLLVGFRPGGAGLTPEARWHPAFYAAGPLAAAWLLVMWRRWLPFDAMALGMLLFLLAGAAGVALLNGLDVHLIHNLYNPMRQAMLFAWIGAVWLVLAPWRPEAVLAWPAHEGRVPRLRPAAWLLVALAAAATWLSYALREREALAGLLPFLALMGGRLAAGRWVKAKR